MSQRPFSPVSLVMGAMLDQQIQQLIDQAPQDGKTPALVKTIAPVLKALASQLRHSEYYLLQTLEHNWVSTTLTHRSQTQLTKTVIYAFPTLKDAVAEPYSSQDSQIVALPIPVIQILFQMLAMQPIDSVVFFEVPGRRDQAAEIGRDRLQELIRKQIQSLSPPLPPDIA